MSRAGTTLDPGLAADMLGAIRHRGPDGIDTVRLGHVAFGHAMLHTTPESLYESLPFVSEDGNLLITSDARLDNRDDILASMPDCKSSAQTCSDSALILSAFQMWGDNCVDHLIGDYAFAIFDRERKGIFCARDHFGVKPFYYVLTPDWYAFATEEKALLTLNFVDASVNVDRVDEFLVGVICDDESTFYNGVRRLPPGSRIFVDDSHFEKDKYWRLSPDIALEPMSDEQYHAKFREVFRQAVRSRTRSAKPVGSFLSGGLDSSSVACVAAQDLAHSDNRLQTISAIFPKYPSVDEREYIEDTVRSNNVVAHIIDCSDQPPLENFGRMTLANDGPITGLGLYRTFNLLAAASQQGVRVMLDGHDGDATLSHGVGQLYDTARNHRWIRFWSALLSIAPTLNAPLFETFWSYVDLLHWRPLLERHKFLQFFDRRLRGIRRRITGSRTRSPKLSQWSNLREVSAEPGSQFARKVQAYHASNVIPLSERHAHVQTLTLPDCSVALELFDKIAAVHQIEMRYPFWDKRLVELCVATPARLKLGSGWTRLNLRRGMEGILTKKVQWRKDKTDFSPVLCTNMHANATNLLRELLDTDGQRLDSYLNLNSAMLALTEFERRPCIEALQCVYPAAALITWLSLIETLNAKADET